MQQWKLLFLLAAAMAEKVRLAWQPKILSRNTMHHQQFCYGQYLLHSLLSGEKSKLSTDSLSLFGSQVVNRKCQSYFYAAFYKHFIVLCLSSHDYCTVYQIHVTTSKLQQKFLWTCSCTARTAMHTVVFTNLWREKKGFMSHILM